MIRHLENRKMITPIHVKKATGSAKALNYFLLGIAGLSFVYYIAIEFAPEDLRNKANRGIVNGVGSVSAILSYLGGKAQKSRELAGDVYSDVDGDGIPDSPAEIKKQALIDKQIAEGRRDDSWFHLGSPETKQLPKANPDSELEEFI